MFQTSGTIDAMFDLILSTYYSIFMVFFILINILILYHFLKKLRNILFDDNEIKSGYILVTGCDTGFGHGAAMAFNERNMFVFAGCLSQESVEKFNQDDNFKGMAFIMNITKKEDISNARQVIEAKVGEEGLWCLVNNAGICTPGPIEWLSEDDMKRTMEVNLWGTVNTTKAMIPLIKKSRGRIVNMISMIGRSTFVNHVSYSMSKYALEAFSDTLRQEMKPWDVSVHIMEPGIHGTNLYNGAEKIWLDLWNVQPESVREQYGESYIKDILKSGDETADMFISNPINVVKAYLHAALSSRPQLRYVVGIDANTVFMAIALLPTAMGDWVSNYMLTNPTPAAVANRRRHGYEK